VVRDFAAADAGHDVRIVAQPLEAGLAPADAVYPEVSTATPRAS
jgi:hypothetical protein